MKPGGDLCQPGALIKAPFGVETSVKTFVTDLNIVFIHHSQHISKRILIRLTDEKALFTDSICSYKFLYYTPLGVLTNN